MNDYTVYKGLTLSQVDFLERQMEDAEEYFLDKVVEIEELQLESYKYQLEYGQEFTEEQKIQAHEYAMSWVKGQLEKEEERLIEEILTESDD